MSSLDTIQGTPYSCESDAGILEMKRESLDYHTKNIGNSVKSSVTPTQLQLMKIDYDTSKQKYESSTCGKSPETDNCLSLQAQISSIRSSIIYFQNIKDYNTANQEKTRLERMIREFDNSKCGSVIAQFKADNISRISDFYNTIDKQRIEEESKYQQKQRIFFGGIILAGAVLLITIFTDIRSPVSKARF